MTVGGGLVNRAATLALFLTISCSYCSVDVVMNI